MPASRDAGEQADGPGEYSTGVPNPRGSANRRGAYRSFPRAPARLDGVLPALPVSDAVIDASTELLRLQRDIELAGSVGVPAGIAERLLEEAGLATDALQRRTERLIAVAAMTSASGNPADADANPDALRDDLETETSRPAHLADAIRQARDGLAELTLAEEVGRDDLARASRRFRALADAARDAREL